MDHSVDLGQFSLTKIDYSVQDMQIQRLPSDTATITKLLKSVSSIIPISYAQNSTRKRQEYK